MEKYFMVESLHIFKRDRINYLVISVHILKNKWYNYDNKKQQEVIA